MFAYSQVMVAAAAKPTIKITESKNEPGSKYIEKDGACIFNPLDNVKKIAKAPVRIAPTRGPAVCGNMRYATHQESLENDSEVKNEKRSLSESPSEVRFDTVTIREYPVEIGDNPAVSRGAPLTMDWEPTNQFEYDMEAYEEHRTPRRTKGELGMHFLLREKLLIENGFTSKQVMKAVVDVNNARAKREATIAGLQSDDHKRESSLEFMKRRLSKTISRVRAKKRRRGEKSLNRYKDMGFSEKTNNTLIPV